MHGFKASAAGGMDSGVVLNLNTGDTYLTNTDNGNFKISITSAGVLTGYIQSTANTNAIDCLTVTKIVGTNVKQLSDVPSYPTETDNYSLQAIFNSQGTLTFDKLKTVSFPVLSHIGKNALAMTFQLCNELTYAEFPELTTIDTSGLYCAFRCTYGTPSLTTVSFPKLSSIGSNGMDYAFQGIKSLTGSLSFPALTSISNYGIRFAFQNCTGLTSVSFPNLTSIGEYGMYYTFYRCTGLTSVSFPKLSSIGTSGMYGAFYQCTGLTSVSFPALTTSGVSITSTSNSLDRCFYQCTGITEVHFPSAFSSYSSYLTKDVLFGGTSTSYCNANLQILFDL